jgi:microcystin-dependent protein
MTIYSPRLKIPIRELDDQPVNLSQDHIDRTAILDQLVLIGFYTLQNRPAPDPAQEGVFAVVTDQPDSPRIDMNTGGAWTTIASAARDGAANQALMRSLGTGAQQACAGNDTRLFTSGDIKCSAALNPPAGWLLCNGSLVTRAQYPNLYAAIGDAYGANDGSTNFALPDMRDVFPVGVGATARGARGGIASVILSIANLPSHDHGTWTTGPNVDHQHYVNAVNTGGQSADHSHVTYMNVGATGQLLTYSGGLAGHGAFTATGTTYTGYGSGGSSNDHSHYVPPQWTGGANQAHAHQIPAQGSGTAVENRPPFQAFNFFIKT